MLRRGDDGGFEPLEPYKYITHLSAAKAGLPIRGGLARIAAWSWLFKAFTTQDWVRFVEIYGQPIRIGRHAPGANKEDMRTLYRAVSNIASDAAALLPAGMNIEFVADSVARRSDVYKDLLHYLDAQVAIAVLGQTLTTQPGDSGSYGLGKVHQMVREDIRRSDSRQLASTLRRDLAIPIVQLNEGPRRAYPRIVIDHKEPADKEAISTALERLLPFGLRVKADEVRSVLDLSKPGADDEVLEPPAPATSLARALARAAGQDGGGDSDLVDAMTARLSRDAAPFTDRTLDLVRGAAKDSASLGALESELIALYPHIDRDRLAGLLGEAIMAAELAGRYDVLDGQGE